ncbi:adenosylcobalamin-dependent ribonucleoside-diphosphate reductase [Candidatus Woesearchaeota archaeon]|jgi:ribonucleoside-diphosphate reductase alpha chain|nr:adenosylcobalamin-dependent ribonucleoside-diphosphate reductase [Candidatus Woesearchaeota archaeon]MBT5396624.1 adenosylcobalamin-dependent ribonucleoside-diphosphate reductase [Candidatus Woesearchaeota archaeon]MBT5924891.1 adenosylcobalamin-dependent ribonucleoside-diphosphate reductase [Candidatus Woesearchaeota archaeon]MBT6367589.1 adenosylcobalamin-dependent ribonucleoside-diphosphate reductase [Candidatus Woesearchaeota archaeon]MBT7763088.1 adenosylcobalamin-dependent ribonucleosi
MDNNDLYEKQREIMEGRTTDLPFSLNALQVVAKRYLVRDEEGNITESPEEMFERVSKALADVELRYGKSQEEVEKVRSQFFDVLTSFTFSPAGRTLANAGGPTRLVSNCIVLNIQDSMESIFQTLKDASLLQQAGSGLGFPLHLMRPAGYRTIKSRGMASGPVSFLRVFNSAFGVIKQQNRHGANMAVMRVDHPDILEFVHSKKIEGDIRNFNVSVGLTSEFMQQVKWNSSEPWYCNWNGTKMKPRRVVRNDNFSFVSAEEVTMTARELFQEIIECAWKNGEPGCVFLDTVNDSNPIPELGRLEACNPCGEQFLHDGDVCNLGSINLEKFAKDDGNIDYEKLRNVTRIATRMLDNVIDLSDFPVEKINNVFRGNRRIGLGIMGFADLLYKIRVPYNSMEGFDIAEKIMGCIQRSSHEMSHELAEEKGMFPNWEKSVYKQRGISMRNAALTNIAPTGTISMVYDVSGGVEPYFALAYHYQNILGGDVELYYMNKHLRAELERLGLYTEDIMERISNEGTLQNIPEIPEETKRIFVTSMDISAADHTRMQAAFQRHIDNAISKTINFPNGATQEDVLQGYILAWELGCKGCTVYRDGSRNEQILNIKKTEDAKQGTNGKDENEMVVVTEQNDDPHGKHEVIKSGKCPDCEAPLTISEGCYTCVQCGSSACSI